METIGRYQILRELGRGAGGVVYLAEDPKIGRRVAIKTIAAGATSGETLRKRLQREARSAGQLSHRNIVTVYEMDDAGPVTFIVMEFVEGRTLRAVMEFGERLRTAQILPLLRQVAEGLDFAHARGVVHRDIKPANIMVAEDNAVKIADFGVAKMLGDATLGLTQAGMAVGTPHYMSPEQVLGKPVTGRSDQFSLGVIAYELLAGKRPFEGDSITSIMYQIVNEDPVREDTTGSIVNLPALPSLLRALAKDPAARYPMCVQFIDELEDGLLAPRLSIPVQAAPAQRQAPPPSPSPPAPAPAPEAAPPAPTAAAPMAVSPNGRSMGRKIAIAVASLLLVAMALLVYHGRPSKPAAPAASTPLTAQPQAPVQSPVPAAPKPAAAARVTPPPAAPAKPASGSFTWNGTLASGDSIEITGNQASMGSVTGKGLPRAMAVIVQTDPPDVSVNEAPAADNGYKLILVNDGRSVSSITVSWRAAKKGEAQE